MLTRNKKLQCLNTLGLVLLLSVFTVMPSSALSDETVITTGFPNATATAGGKLRISGDGSTAAFITTQALVGADTNGKADVYVYDVDTTAIERVSVDSSENESTDGAVTVGSVSLSDDGRYVVFDSNYSDLVAGDTNAVTDVFVRDRTAGTTERISVDSAEGELNGSSQFGSISDDGRYIAFESNATDAVAGDTNGERDVFVRDTTTGTTERVSVDSSENQVSGGANYLYGRAISGDGRYVVFNSEATDVTAGDTNGNGDVFLRDRTTGTTVRISVDENGDPSPEWSEGGRLARTGSSWCFVRKASWSVLTITEPLSLTCIATRLVMVR